MGFRIAWFQLRVPRIVWGLWLPAITLLAGAGSRATLLRAPPPVYYSQPVARPYGYSPFAYPGWVRTPEIAEAACEPLTLDNPYVTPSATDSDEIDAEMVEAEDDEFAIKPLVIENPFVLQRPQQAEATELAAVEYVD